MLKLRAVTIILTSVMLFSMTACTSEKQESTPTPDYSRSTVKDVAMSSVVENSGKYQLKCSYLINPDSIIEIADKSAAFWQKAYDEENGGFYTYVNRDGSIDMSRPYKVALLQSRDAYGLTRAYQLTGKKEYLDYARKGLDFMYKNAWDSVNGGWYQEMNRDGTLVSNPIEGVNWNDTKWTFNQLYSLCGICAMYDATRSNTDKEWLEKSYSFVDKKIWDSRKGCEGYFDQTDKDWSNPSGKSLGSTMDAMTTQAEVLCLLEPEKYKGRLIALADNMNTIIKGMDGREFGFPDMFSTDWSTPKQQRYISSGNYLKPAWCLARTYLIEPNPEYKDNAQKLVNGLLNSNAYDKVNGGPYTALDPKTGKASNNSKCWWELEQAVTGGLTNYYISNNAEYLKMADESLSFFMKYMYDSKYGDVFGNIEASGSNPDMQKGNYWKGGYHSLELFYYTYLYGNLMLNNKPASLYYNISSEKEAREITLKPISLGENKLTIKDITLDGKAYKDFDGKKCILKLPADVGGEFKVTFSPSEG